MKRRLGYCFSMVSPSATMGRAIRMDCARRHHVAVRPGALRFGCRTPLAALAALLFACTAAPAQQQPSGDTDDGRYVYNRVQDGFVRLDTRTGQVSLCGRRTVGWTCDAIPEERGALEAEIARLQGENATMKKELLSRGIALPGTVKPETPPPVAKGPELRLPSNADIERAMTFVENVWRRMVEIIGNLQKDILKKT